MNQNNAKWTLMALIMTIVLSACSNPRDQFNSALEEAIATAKTDEERQRIERVKRVGDNLTDAERAQFVEAWERKKKAEAAFNAGMAK